MNADFRINGKVIETERLILRPFSQTDLEDFMNMRPSKALVRWQAGNTMKVLPNLRVL